MYGLVLEGGGARGAYHIGAYKALLELDIKISAVSGTSVGALNGAMIAQGEIEKAYNIWSEISPSKALAVDEARLAEFHNQIINPANLPYYARRISEIISEGGLDVSPLKGLLEENINENRVRNSKIKLGIVTVSLTDFKALELFVEDIPQGHLVDYLMASAGFPGFKIERIEGKRFIDGGFHDNLPIKLLQDKGYTDIIVVRTYGPGRHRRIQTEGMNIRYISPVDDLGGIMDFDSEVAKQNLQLGYFDAMRVFQNLKGKKYYIKPDRGEVHFLEVLSALPEDKALYVGKILGFSGLPYRRMLFEQIVPRLAELLNIPRTADYEEIAILLLEQLAFRYQVERFKIYTFEEFLNEIEKQYIPHRGRLRKDLPGLVKRTRMVPLAAKEEIFNEIVYQLFEGLFYNGYAI